MNQNTTKFLIIEDHEVVVFALKEILFKHFPNTHLQAVNSVDEGVRTLKGNSFDLIILDIDVNGGNSPKMISQLRQVQPQIKILIHSGMEEDKGSLRYLSAGADGFFSKKDPFQLLPVAIKTILNGKRYINHSTQALITDNYFNHPGTSDFGQQSVVFSSREQQVISLLLAGKWTKEIADVLDLKLSTVSTHKARIFEKLEISSIIELYKKIEVGWPELLEKA